MTGEDRLFQDRTIEVEERADEAVVAKEARVKEELTIKKDAFYAMIMLTVSRVHPRGVFLYRIAASKRPMFRFHDLQEVRRMLKELGVAHSINAFARPVELVLWR